MREEVKKHIVSQTEGYEFESVVIDHDIIESVDSMRIFSDNSSLEIFLNNGEEVFSTRIYNDLVDSTLTLKGNGTARIEKWNF